MVTIKSHLIFFLAFKAIEIFLRKTMILWETPWTLLWDSRFKVGNNHVTCKTPASVRFNRESAENSHFQTRQRYFDLLQTGEIRVQQPNIPYCCCCCCCFFCIFIYLTITYGFLYKVQRLRRIYNCFCLFDFLFVFCFVLLIFFVSVFLFRFLLVFCQFFFFHLLRLGLP